MLKRALQFAMLAAVACGSETPKPSPPPSTELEISRVYLVLPAGQSPAALYATLWNGTNGDDTLRQVRTAVTNPVMLHSPMPSMTMIDALPVPADRTTRLAPGGAHGMIEGLASFARGDSVRMTFHFASGRVVVAHAHVIAYADVDSAAPPIR